MSRGIRVAGLLAGYLLLAFLFAWPLPARLRTHLPTPADGDTAVYVWNVWAFRHEIAAHGHSPFETSHILVPGPPVPLVLHNYTVFADLLAFPLVPSLGVVGAFNLVHLVQPAIAAFTMFLLASHLTRRRAAAWLAGLAFGFSPYVLARGMGHYSLAGAAPLPLFTLFALKAVETRRRRYGAAAGAAMAWAAVNDPYYAIYCVLIGVALAFATFTEVRLCQPVSSARARLRRIALGVAVVSAALAVLIGATGGWEVRLGGVIVRMRGFYTPVLLATVAALVWIALRFRASLRDDPPLRIRDVAAIVLAAALAAAVLLLPMVPEVVRTLASGNAVGGRIYWRSSAPGVDLLAFIVPNPTSPLLGGASRAWLQTLPNGFVENTASLPLVALLTIAFACWRAGFVLPRFWMAFGVAFALLALGPFVHIAGAHTYVPGPWALVRYLPIVGMARMPGRLAVLVTMAVAVIVAMAVETLLASSKRPVLLSAMISVILIAELSPLPRHVYSVAVPGVYGAIRDDPRDVSVLELPFGVMDGLSGVGNFSPAVEFFQTVHGKRIFGGYISRVPAATVEDQKNDPLLGTLLALSEGREPAPDAERQALEGRRPWQTPLDPAYVVIDTGRTSPRLREFAMRAFALEPIAADGGRELYRLRPR